MKKILLVVVLLAVLAVPVAANEAQAVLAYLAAPDAAGIVVVQGQDATGIGTPLSWRLGHSPVSFDLIFAKSDAGGLLEGEVADIRAFPGLSLTMPVNEKLNLHAYVGLCLPPKEYGAVRIGEFEMRGAVYWGIKQTW